MSVDGTITLKPAALRALHHEVDRINGHRVIEHGTGTKAIDEVGITTYVSGEVFAKFLVGGEMVTYKSLGTF